MKAKKQFMERNKSPPQTQIKTSTFSISTFYEFSELTQKSFPPFCQSHIRRTKKERIENPLFLPLFKPIIS